MKQIIPFVKDLSLDTKISEITSIALEHDLKMENSDSIVGVFTISGKYKMNEISINEEVFEKKINFDITLDDKYDAKKAQIDIDDFYYEIINDEYLRVHIDVKVDNLVYYIQERTEQKAEIQIIKEDSNDDIKDEEITENKDEEIGELKRNINLENNNETEDCNMQEEKKEVTEVKDVDYNKEDTINITNQISSNFLGNEERYTTYKVHIIRENENIQTVMEKYNVSKDELEKYNNLDNIILGTKVIVPLKDE